MCCCVGPQRGGCVCWCCDRVCLLLVLLLLLQRLQQHTQCSRKAQGVSSPRSLHMHMPQQQQKQQQQQHTSHHFDTTPTFCATRARLVVSACACPAEPLKRTHAMQQVFLLENTQRTTTSNARARRRVLLCCLAVPTCRVVCVGVLLLSGCMAWWGGKGREAANRADPHPRAVPPPKPRRR